MLIVDDEMNITDVCGRYLQREGYQVIMAHDGESALALWKAEQPDLVILDIMLPGKNGWEVCEEIRHEQDIPIIMLMSLILPSRSGSGRYGGLATSSGRVIQHEVKNLSVSVQYCQPRCGTGQSVHHLSSHAADVAHHASADVSHPDCSDYLHFGPCINHPANRGFSEQYQ